MCNMLMHVIVHRGCADTVEESALKVGFQRKPPATLGNRTCISILPSFWSDALPTELSCPVFVHIVRISLFEWL